MLRLTEGAAGGTVRLPMSKASLASQLGMTRETFSRALSGLARHGIRIEGGGVTITDIAAAQARFPLDPLIDAPEPILPLPAIRLSITPHVVKKTKASRSRR
ncbi:MAG: helix-turn-helix domain-containing protein [Proteobacteria bacterium]|nr:helix-turn-helix domain-containing protein [Pseudomonadota bacterium]